MCLNELLKYAFSIEDNGQKYFLECDKAYKSVQDWFSLPNYKKIEKVMLFVFPPGIYLNRTNIEGKWNINGYGTSYNFKFKRFEYTGEDYLTDDFFLCLDVIEKELKNAVK